MLQTADETPWSGDLPIPQLLPTQSDIKMDRAWISKRTPRGIQTQDPNVRAVWRSLFLLLVWWLMAEIALYIALYNYYILVGIQN
jgi:hypothetical protein